MLNSGLVANDRAERFDGVSGGATAYRDSSAHRNGGHHVGVLQRRHNRLLHHSSRMDSRSIRRRLLPLEHQQASLVALLLSLSFRFLCLSLSVQWTVQWFGSHVLLAFHTGSYKHYFYLENIDFFVH